MTQLYDLLIKQSVTVSCDLQLQNTLETQRKNASSFDVQGFAFPAFIRLVSRESELAFLRHFVHLQSGTVLQVFKHRESTNLSIAGVSVYL